MEHNTNLWTSPYNDEKYGEEKGASWKYFQEFIKMDSPRDIVSFHEHLSKIMSKKGRTRKPTIQTIYEYSAKWKWFKRAEAYDNWKRDVEDAEMKEKIRQIRNERIEASKKRMLYQDQLFDDLMNDMEMATNQKVYGASKNSEAIRNETASFNEIVNEGKTKLDASVDADVKQDIKQESKDTITIFDEVDKQLGLDNNEPTGDKGHSDNTEG